MVTSIFGICFVVAGFVALAVVGSLGGSSDGKNEAMA